MTVCELYNDLKGANNFWQQGHFRPLSFEGALYDSILEIFNDNRKIWEQSQVVTDALRPFFQSGQLNIKDFASGGVVPYPKDYCSFSSLRFFSKTKTGPGTLCADIEKINKEGERCRPLREEEKAEKLLNSEELYERPITKVDNSRWGSVCAHEIVGPSLDEVYSTQLSTGFKVVPKKVGVVVLDYLSLPIRAKFIYTVDDTHRIICNPEKCGKILFGDEMKPEIMSRLKTKYASFIGNSQRYAEGKNETETVGS